MNRRTVVKGIAGIAGLVASISLVKFRHTKNAPMPAGGLLQLRGLIGEIAETIIPKTDTPGASDALVAEWVVKLITECEPERVQVAFARWLIAVEKDCRREFGRPFSESNVAQRIALLTRYEHMERNRSLIRRARLRLFGVDNVELMKKYTVISYCTSLTGATQALAYDYIPANFDPCVIVSADQPCWATS